MKSVTLRGSLTWNSKERRSDRYGGISLAQETVDVNAGEESPNIDYTGASPFVGKRVNITATIVVSNKSCHIGDLIRGISPSQTPVGTTLDLGVGKIVEIDEENPGSAQIIFCRDGREEMADWIDPHVLYRLHDHVVDLTITDATDVPFVAPEASDTKQGSCDGSIMIIDAGIGQSKQTFSND